MKGRNTMMRFICGGLLLALGSLAAIGQESGDKAGPFVVVCPIETQQGTMIDDGILILVNRAIRAAQGADAIIFIIDTPGGRLDSAIEITKSILKAPCKTIAYVTGMGAISAGALIAYSCDDIVMAPGSNIGASQVVFLTGEGVTPAGEKETSFLRAKFAALGELKGHNPDIGMAMVDKDVELIAIPRGDGTFDVRATNPNQAGTASSKSQLEKVVEQLEDKTDLPLGPLKDIARELSKPAEKPSAPETATSAPPAPPDTRGPHIILGSDKLLTLTPDEALKYRLIQYTPRSLDQVLRIYGYENDRIERLQLTWSEELFRWLTSPTVSSILLLVGLGGIYLEFKTPGFGLPGIIGIIALALFFGARNVIGLADWADLLLVLVGLMLIGVEVFLIPGFGIVGTLGILSLLAGLILSFTFSDFTFTDYSWNFDRLRDAGTTVTITAIALTVFVVVLWKLFPHTRFYGHLVLTEEQQLSRGFTVQTDSESLSAIGLKGVATSMLRPAGRGRFGDRTFQVVSRAEFIEQGTPIVIVEVDGNRYVVDRLKETA